MYIFTLFQAKDSRNGETLKDSGRENETRWGWEG